jgi:hypothetical protein
LKITFYGVQKTLAIAVVSKNVSFVNTFFYKLSGSITLKCQVTAQTVELEDVPKRGRPSIASKALQSTETEEDNLKFHKNCKKTKN